ncbi:MAG: hypothetical protein HYU59_08305 [Magnetospirillum gryphiswaldense]|nr:hypothetical protein [Magnetospirillum gryphiswaldense]
MHPHAYRLLTDSPAKKKAKKLVEIVGLMGFELKLSRAQEITAQLMGYEDWAELVRVTREAPERGIPDQMLPANAATARQERQSTLLAEELHIDTWDANSILVALAPTGEGHGMDWPTVEKLGLRLVDEDLAWLEESMALVREFDAAVRPLYGLSGAYAHDLRIHGLTHVRVQIVKPGKRKMGNVHNTTPADIVSWVADGFPVDLPLTGELLADVTARAETACQTVATLDARIHALGAAPMLAPINQTFLMLFRSGTSKDGKHFYSALNPEPWLHIGFDLRGFCFCPENEWNASRALALQLALRREFLDAGWTGLGGEWTVTFREGNSAKETLTVRAASAGSAYAWVAASRGAIRMAKKETVSSVSLVSVTGPDGAVEPELALAAAVNEAVIRRGKLLKPTQLRVRGRRKAA